MEWKVVEGVLLAFAILWLISRLNKNFWVVLFDEWVKEKTEKIVTSKKFWYFVIFLILLLVGETSPIFAYLFFFWFLAGIYWAIRAKAKS